MALIEVRAYHYDPDRHDAYRRWAAEARRVLAKRFVMKGFWIDSSDLARISGSDPMGSSIGPGNVSWTIRWRDIQEREREWDAPWEDSERNEIWSRHPGFDGYLQLSVRFLDEV